MISVIPDTIFTLTLKDSKNHKINRNFLTEAPCDDETARNYYRNYPIDSKKVDDTYTYRFPDNTNFCWASVKELNTSPTFVLLTLNDSNNLPTSLNVLNVVLFLLQFVDNCIFAWYNY